jgi:hypothetical protein
MKIIDKTKGLIINLKKNGVLKVVFTAILLCFFPLQIEALDYPHNSSNHYSCESCHYVYASESALLPVWTAHIPEDIDDTQYNTLCWSCHDNLTAPFMNTHSSLVLDNSYDDWAVECRVCHNPHKQQFRAKNHGSQAYVFQGTVGDVDADTLTASGASWETNQYTGYILVPNIEKKDYNYRILSNTGNVLTIDDRGNDIEIDLSKVSPTDTFGISYGKLVYDIIYLDKINDETLGGPPVTRTGTRTVKFFNNEGANSFADGDLTLEGICEACHQQTNHFRNYDPVLEGDIGYDDYDRLHSNMDYPAGTNCTICHKHENGFMGMGSGAHETHMSEDYGPKMTCTVGDLGCHGSNNPASGPVVLFSDNENFDDTTACDACHSPGGSYNGVTSTGESIGAKDNWDTGVYTGGILTTGKEKWCAGCHDEVPSVIDSVSAPNVIGDESAATRYGTGYGFYKTGHGLPSVELSPATGYGGAGAGCLDCHDATVAHIDGDARTYQAEGTYLTDDPASANYQDGYRLIDVDTGGANGTYPMHMPRTGNVYFTGYGPGVPGVREDWEFALCFECHDRDGLLGTVGDPGTRTNFIDKQTAREGFDTGAFDTYWSTGGDDVWAITSSEYYSLIYSAGSPSIADNQSSYLEMTLNVIQDGTITFWFKVSSESDDYLRFKIDTVEQGSWSGTVDWIDWTKVSFPVTAGSRTFRWEYTKGASGSGGSDAVWIDEIGFPNDIGGSRYNAHDLHTDGRNGPLAPETPQYDSDFDGTGDSRISCPSCHNVHGSPSPVMFRYGDLAAATSPVASIEPFLDLQYVGESCVSTSAPMLEDSTGGAGTRSYSSGAGTIARNGVCAMCHNEFWFNGYDNGTEFTGYSRVPVISPEIWSVGGQAASDIVYVVFSEGVYSDLDSVGDLTTADFTFSGGTIDSIIHTAGDAVAVLDLSVVPVFGTDTISAAAVDSIYDETNSPVDTTAFAIQDDTGDPVITVQSPANGSSGIIRNNDLSLILTDSGSGIDWTSFSMQLSGNKGYSETYTDADTSIVSYTGTPGRYTITVSPDVDFGKTEIITVTVSVDDSTGNSASSPTWSFTTGDQGKIILHPSGASFTGLADPFEITPSDGDWADVLDCNDGDSSYVSKCCGWSGAPGENHSFTVDMDDPVASDLQGRSIEGINIGVYARYNNGSGSINIGYSAGSAGSSMGDTALAESSNYTFFTQGDTFSSGTVFYSDIEIMDAFVSRTGVSGENLRVTEVYAEVLFGDMDTSAPTASSLNPANLDTGVAVGSNLSLTIADAESGIDWSTFQIQLTGTGYSETYYDTDTLIVSKTGTPASYNVTINPDTDFPAGEVITVTVNVDNYAGISLTPPTWSFTTGSGADTDPPVISLRNPGPGDYDVPLYSDITFTLSDTGSGVDWATLTVVVEGDTYGTFTTVITNTGDPASYDVTVNPDDDFYLDEIITVTVNVDDIAGNPMPQSQWEFYAKESSMGT